MGFTSNEYSQLAVVIGQRDERPAVSLAQYSHQGREAYCRRRYLSAFAESSRKSDGVQAHAPRTIGANAIDAIDRADNRVDRVVALEVIPEYVDADFLVVCPELRNGFLDAIDRVTVARCIPVSHAVDDCLAASR